MSYAHHSTIIHGVVIGEARGQGDHGPPPQSPRSQLRKRIYPPPPISMAIFLAQVIAPPQYENISYAYAIALYAPVVSATARMQ